MPELRYVDALTKAHHEEMARDERVVVLGEDVGRKGGVFGVTMGLYEKFGEERVIDSPLAESSIAGVAIGMAANGLLPIAEFQFADFIHPAFNPIVSEARRRRYRSNGGYGCPVVFRAPYGGSHGTALYHSQSIEALYAHVPGMKVVTPSTPYDVKGLLKCAARSRKRTTRYPSAPRSSGGRGRTSRSSPSGGCCTRRCRRRRSWPATGSGAESW